jgi:hypothetical protein
VHLSEREQQMVTRMRKQECQWRWAKYGALFAGVVSAVVVVFFLFVAIPRIQSTDSASGGVMMAIIFPIILVFVGTATICFTLVIRDWHGNATRSLLLKLIDAETEQDRANDKAA